MDFIGPLPPDDGFDTIITFTDHLNSDIRLVPSHLDLTVEELTSIFFDEWYCENSLLLNIISDQDKLFTSKFWKALHLLTGIKLKMSMAYHPQTDGVSEHTNKTINQCVHFQVNQMQHEWKHALPRIRFNLMNTMNTLTGFSPFQLHMGCSPCIIPPLMSNGMNDMEDICALDVIKQLEADINEAKDNLMAAKISQSLHANETCTEIFSLKIGDRVLLSMLNRQNEYKEKGENRVAKFMPCFDGPYVILKVDANHSTVTLDLPNQPHIFLTFHMSQVIPFVKNDPSLFPAHQLLQPPPVVIDNGEEYFVDRILDKCK
jgi:hypothetical protein